MNKPPDNPRRALGKGLSALLPQRPVVPPVQAPPAVETAPPPPVEPPRAAGPTLVAIDLIDPNPVQPRTIFQPDRLQELAVSIQANGIIQPLIVRQKEERYELIAGERRWRAARIAGLADVPVVVHNTSEERLLEVSLIENIQRDDLNPIEVAQAFDRLSREYHLSHDDIARRTGKERSSVTNTMRLLRLPEEVQVLVAEHRLQMGHARAILGLPDADAQRQLAEKAAAQGLSVRQVERVVQQLTAERTPGDEQKKPQDPNVRAAADELERVLGTRVKIVERTDQRGRIEIEYYSQEDLDRIYNLIVQEK